MSNLLDKSSIVLTPTGYDNSKVLCVKPSDGSGDFDFSRNSAATRVNAQGLVENVQILSSNLVQNPSFSEEGVQEVSNGSFSQEGVQLITNGSFDTDSDWGKQTSNWTIANGYAVCDGLQTSNSSLFQDFAVVNGVSYKIDFTITDSANDLNLILGATTIGQYGSGTHSIYVTKDANASARIFFQATASNGFQGSIDNVSVREVGQDWDFGGDWELVNGTAEILTSTNSFLIQSNVVDLSVKTYKLQYEIISTNGSNFRLAGGNSAFGSINLDSATVGIKTIYLTSNGTKTLLQFNQNAFRGSITNISVKEVGQNWTLGTGWEIGNSVANAVDAAFGSQLVDSATLTASKKYSVSFVISNYIKGSVRATVGNVSSSDVSANGSFTFVITSANTNAFKMQTRSGGSGTSLSVTNISVIEITDDTNLPRINYEGFSYQDALGSELITNGYFATDSDWNLGTGVIIANSKLTKNDPSVGNTSASQGAVFTVGKTYKYKLVVSGNLTASDKVVGFFTDFTSAGTYEGYFTANATSLVFSLRGSTNVYSIDNVSVKEYLGQSVVPGSGCGSWLWESQSTNLVTDSQNYNSTYWGGQRGNLSDGGVGLFYLSPNSNVIKYEVNQTQFNQMYCRLPSSVTIGNTYTQQGYVKCDDAPYIHFQVQTLSGNPTIVWDNVNNTVISSDPSIDSYNITSLNDGWVKAEITYTASVSSIYASLKTYFSTSSTTNWAGVPVGTIAYQTFVQVEQQSYATSYIPTEGSTVTRNQDVCTNGGSLASINSTSGVLYAEFKVFDSDNSYKMIEINDGSSSNNRVVLYVYGSNIFGFIKSNGNTNLNVFSAETVTNFNKVAIKWGSVDTALWVNGVEINTGTASTFTQNILSDLSFLGAGNQYFFGKTKALAVWKEALSDSELQSLTTI